MDTKQGWNNEGTQCPLSGGSAVYKARSLYAQVVPGKWLYDDESNCSVAGLSWRTGQQNNPIMDASPKVYPNPTSSTLTFECKGLEGGAYDIQIFDMLGRIVFKESFSSIPPEFKLNVSKWAKGVYTYIIMGVKEYNGKIIVE